MFVQMRVLMPVGFFDDVRGTDRRPRGAERGSDACKAERFSGMPFFLAGALGMILMLVFAFRMDSSDPKVNWMEQTVNSLAQICFFIGLMLA